MKIDLTDLHGFKVITVTGQISQLKDSISLKSVINSLLEEKQIRICLSLKAMEYIDSAAINVLIYAKNQITKMGGEFCLLEPNDYVMDVISVVGLKDFFKIHASIDALKSAH